MKHIMLDLETMGTGPNAAIVAVGACEFSPYGQGIERTFYRTVDLTDAVKHGSVDGGTIKWWLNQSAEARSQTFNGDALPLGDALFRFTVWLETGDVAVWGNGATFDNVIIRSAFRSVGLPVPWAFYNDKCYRTVVNLIPEEIRPKRINAGTAHNALDDAVAQALHLQQCYEILFPSPVAAGLTAASVGASDIG